MSIAQSLLPEFDHDHYAPFIPTPPAELVAKPDEVVVGARPVLAAAGSM